MQKVHRIGASRLESSIRELVALQPVEYNRIVTITPVWDTAWSMIKQMPSYYIVVVER